MMTRSRAPRFDAASAHSHRRWLLLAAAGAFAGAALAQAAAPNADVPAAAQRSARIMQAIGDAACDSDAQCRVIGIGARACGGPQRYVAWSTGATDEAALRDLVEADAVESRKEQEKARLSSTCVIPPIPDAHCRRDAQGASARCVLLERGNARATPR
jgi:hypothetical protein